MAGNVYGYARSPRRRPLALESSSSSSSDEDEDSSSPSPVKPSSSFVALVSVVPRHTLSRSTTSRSARVLSDVRLGDRLIVLQKREDANGTLWYKARTADDVEGWIKASCVRRAAELDVADVASAYVTRGGATQRTSLKMGELREGSVALLGKCHEVDTESLEESLHATRLTAAALRQRRRRIMALLGTPDPTLAIKPAYRPVVVDVLGVDGGTSATGVAPTSSVANADLADLDEEALTWELERIESLLAVAEDGARAVSNDLRDTRQLERYESGRETRDVLENGERRALMEARLGREVTKADVEAELGLPWEERRRRVAEGADAMLSQGYRPMLPATVSYTDNEKLCM